MPALASPGDTPVDFSRLPLPFCLQLPPQGTGVQAMPVAQEIKDAAAALPDITVPTVPARDPRLIHFERAMGILPVGMMPSKRTRPDALAVQFNIGVEERKGVLLGTPGLNG